MNNARVLSLMTAVASIAIATFASIIAQPAQAQTTLTWASPGIGPNIGDGGNWVGGVAPNFATDLTADSAIFSAGTNTSVKLRNVLTGDSFATVTFDPTAPAYTFSLPTGNTTNHLVILPGGNMTNNSVNTQTFTGLPDISINSVPATVGTLAAASGNAGTKLSFNLNQLRFSNLGGTAGADMSRVDLSTGFDVRTVSINGVVNVDPISTLNVTSTLSVFGNAADGTGGTLFITGDSGTNTGRLVIGTGAKVQISNNNALGAGGTILPNATGADNETRIGGGGTDNGRLELTGNITVNEAFRLGARQHNQSLYDNNHSPHILNVSGNNTLTGPFGTVGGGNTYNFGSSSDTLTVQSDFLMPNSGERFYTFQGTGNMVFNGNFKSGPDGGGTNVDMTFVKFDSGKTTLNGSASTFVGHLMIYDGTLALGAAAGITFAPLADDSQVPPVVFIDTPGKFDVSAKVGGYTLTQSVLGNGTAVGSLIMASGTQVVPGGTVTRDSQDLSPSSFGDAVGKLTFQNSLDLSAGANVAWQLGALSTANPGTDFDQISVGGNLALAGTSTLTLDFSILDLAGTGPGSGDAFWTSNHTWKIIDTAGNTGNTNFTTLVNGGPFAGGGTFTTSVGATASIAGDANNDGVVNIFDINFVSSNWGTTGPNGDVNHDNTVNIFDINLISSNWNHTGPVGNLGDILLNYSSTGGATAVPEPSSLVLLLMGAVLANVRFVRRSRMK